MKIMNLSSRTLVVKCNRCGKQYEDLSVLAHHKLFYHKQVRSYGWHRKEFDDRPEYQYHMAWPTNEEE